jgi:hypothetical protein
MESAVVGLARRGQARADSLSVSGQPVAVTVLLRSGACAWLWKIAYDETFARLSPGVQLTLDITADLLRDEMLAAADSCATPDHPMIDHLWRERLALSQRAQRRPLHPRQGGQARSRNRRRMILPVVVIGI